MQEEGGKGQEKDVKNHNLDYYYGNSVEHVISPKHLCVGVSVLICLVCLNVGASVYVCVYLCLSERREVRRVYIFV